MNSISGKLTEQNQATVRLLQETLHQLQPCALQAPVTAPVPAPVTAPVQVQDPEVNVCYSPIGGLIATPHFQKDAGQYEFIAYLTETLEPITEPQDQEFPAQKDLHFDRQLAGVMLNPIVANCDFLFTDGTSSNFDKGKTSFEKVRFGFDSSLIRQIVVFTDTSVMLMGF